MTAVPVTAQHHAQPKGGLATLVVLLIMVGIVAGGFYAQQAVAGLPSGPVEVARGVTVTPLPDWQFGGRTEDGNTILLSRGSGSLAVSVTDGADVAAALNGLRDEWVASGTVTASQIVEVTDRRGGQTGMRFAYSGTFADLPAAVEGEVTAFAGTGILVVFDAWAGVGDSVAVGADVATMIDGTVIP